jgi:multiple sugar transport system ATP-binding protein
MLGIRAENVRVVAPSHANTSESFTGEVELLEPLGSDTFIEIGRDKHNLTARVEPDRRLKVGETVGVQLPRHKLHFFDMQSGERLNL